jgi:ubiquitin-conjugating enzyme E2 variant
LSSDTPRGYASSHRAYEWCGISLAVFCGGWLLVRLSRAELSHGELIAATVAGILGADFASGLIHWVFDTWGTTSTPVVGQLAIRTFREHHTDPTAIVRHDFIETNGHNFALSVLPLVVGLLVTDEQGRGSPTLGACLFALALFVALTSQIHKWAHMQEPPRAIRWLQTLHLFISPERHGKHHVAPFTRHYCITTGWLNAPLRALRFFETLESAIAAMTGAIPRRAEPIDEISSARDQESPRAAEAE